MEELVANAIEPGAFLRVDILRVGYEFREWAVSAFALRSFEIFKIHV